MNRPPGHFQNETALGFFLRSTEQGSSARRAGTVRLTTILGQFNAPKRMTSLFRIDDLFDRDRGPFSLTRAQRPKTGLALRD